MWICLPKESRRSVYLFGENGCTACDVFCDALIKAGIPAVFEEYEGVKHGFGLGVGTAAEGWLNRAVDLWEEVINESG